MKNLSMECLKVRGFRRKIKVIRYNEFRCEAHKTRVWIGNDQDFLGF